jgi:hypothetical protein
VTTNQIHLRTVANSERRVLKLLRMRYARQFSRSQRWRGYDRQKRYFSSPPDDDCLLAAISFVLRIPYRAGKERKLEKGRCAITAWHYIATSGVRPTTKSYLRRESEVIRNWPGWLADRDEQEEISILRRDVKNCTVVRSRQIRP